VYKRLRGSGAIWCDLDAKNFAAHRSRTVALHAACTPSGSTGIWEAASDAQLAKTRGRGSKNSGCVIVAEAGEVELERGFPRDARSRRLALRSGGSGSVSGRGQRTDSRLGCRYLSTWVGMPHETDKETGWVQNGTTSLNGERDAEPSGALLHAKRETRRQSAVPKAAQAVRCRVAEDAPGGSASEQGSSARQRAEMLESSREMGAKEPRASGPPRTSAEFTSWSQTDMSCSTTARYRGQGQRRSLSS